MMLETAKNSDASGLDYTKFHDPLVSIIITHFNYSDHVRDALLSVLAQTHRNWECVIVDDGSTPAHRETLDKIMAAIGSEKIRIIGHTENRGQIPAFFTGLEHTSGEFACLLDPDDRYAPTFLEEVLAAHLSGVIFCPIVATEQYLFSGNSIITGCYSSNTMNAALVDAERVGNATVIPLTIEPRLLYTPAEIPGWHWTTTSAMMFRRSALHYLRPHRQLAYKGSADAYLANGAHLLGGTLFLTKPLIYRTIHADNRWIDSRIFSIMQNMAKPDGVDLANNDICISDVTEAIRHNGGGAQLDLNAPKARPKKLTTFQRLRRSIRKRWRRLTGAPEPS